jgi:hypothetical protein
VTPDERDGVAGRDGHAGLVAGPERLRQGERGGPVPAELGIVGDHRNAHPVTFGHLRAEADEQVLDEPVFVAGPEQGPAPPFGALHVVDVHDEPVELEQPVLRHAVRAGDELVNPVEVAVRGDIPAGDGAGRAGMQGPEVGDDRHDAGPVGAGRLGLLGQRRADGVLLLEDRVARPHLRGERLPEVPGPGDPLMPAAGPGLGVGLHAELGLDEPDHPGVGALAADVPPGPGPGGQDDQAEHGGRLPVGSHPVVHRDRGGPAELGGLFPVVHEPVAGDRHDAGAGGADFTLEGRGEAGHRLIVCPGHSGDAERPPG